MGVSPGTAKPATAAGRNANAMPRLLRTAAGLGVLAAGVGAFSAGNAALGLRLPARAPVARARARTAPSLTQLRSQSKWARNRDYATSRCTAHLQRRAEPPHHMHVRPGPGRLVRGTPARGSCLWVPAFPEPTQRGFRHSRNPRSVGGRSVLGTHAFLEFHFPRLCWHTVLGFGCSRSFNPLPSGPLRCARVRAEKIDRDPWGGRIGSANTQATDGYGVLESIIASLPRESGAPPLLLLVP